MHMIILLGKRVWQRVELPRALQSSSSLKPRSDFTELATVEGTARLKFLLIIFFQAYLVPSIYTR